VISWRDLPPIPYRYRQNQVCSWVQFVKNNISSGSQKHILWNTRIFFVKKIN